MLLSDLRDEELKEVLSHRITEKVKAQFAGETDVALSEGVRVRDCIDELTLRGYDCSLLCAC